jgi:hypothetical protein
MPAETPGRMAGGTIYPSRFVAKQTGNPYRVIQASADTDQVIGISDHRSKYLAGMFGVSAPYPAAELDDGVRVYGDGETTLLEAGAAFTADEYLVSDSSGRGVRNLLGDAAVKGIGARAIESATAAGQLVKVQVHIQPYQGT